MGQAVFSSNTSIKVNGAVSATRSSSGTLYTAPSNGYAIIQIYCTVFNSGFTVTVGTREVIKISSVDTQIGSVYVGPSQAVAISSSNTIVISGVEYANSP